VVLLDTPGIHRPRTLLGERTNERAVETLREVDVVCLLVEANRPIGPGDRFVARLVQQAQTPRIAVVNKVDLASKAEIAGHLAQVGDLGEWDAFVPLSARTGDGVDALIAEIEARLPEGPVYYPGGEVSDQPETVLAAELLREKLLGIARDELPHSIVVTAELLDDEDDEEDGDEVPDDGILRLRATVRVERDSQKGIVIGKGGTVIRDAGTAARKELEALLGTRVYLETRVRVDKDWQRRAGSLDRLGL
jgi:GTP-binding protein Era